jgi:hypothetical protein
MTITKFIQEISATRTNGIIVWADTSGFSAFARRTIELPEVMKNYVLALYNQCIQYQVETGGFLKHTGDGFFSFHEYHDELKPELVNEILGACIRLSDAMETIIKVNRFPRPDGFRVRVVEGPTWALTIVRSLPKDCDQEGCEMGVIHDYIGAQVIFGDKLLELYRKEPLICCSHIQEIGKQSGLYNFRKIIDPHERRIPDNVFKEDIEHLWAFSRNSAAPI